MSLRLFISHRDTKADHRIAETLREFVVGRFRGESTVHTSGDFLHRPIDSADRRGTLADALSNSNLLFVLYTGTGKGWPQQMWEIGLASARPELATTVFRSVDGPLPDALSNKPTVELRSHNSMHQFARSFFPEFAEDTEREAETFTYHFYRHFPPPSDRLGSGGYSPRDKGAAPTVDFVKCSVFAPPEVAPAETILVQVFAHLPEDTDRVNDLVATFDTEAALRGSRSLPEKIRRGSQLTFCLTIRGAAVDEPCQSTIWLGEPTAVQFGVNIPKDASND